MKLSKTVVRKILIGAILVVLCAGISAFIKEVLDTKDPESALPVITIAYSDTQIPDQSIYRAGYTWSFFTTVEDWQSPSMAPEDLPVSAVEIAAGTPLSISFSNTPSELRIWRAQGLHSSDFLELSCDVPGQFLAPAAAGQYLYRLNADWGTRGDIQYYFALSVVA